MEKLLGSSALLHALLTFQLLLCQALLPLSLQLLSAFYLQASLFDSIRSGFRGASLKSSSSPLLRPQTSHGDRFSWWRGLWSRSDARQVRYQVLNIMRKFLHWPRTINLHQLLHHEWK